MNALYDCSNGVGEDNESPHITRYIDGAPSKTIIVTEKEIENFCRDSCGDEAQKRCILINHILSKKPIT